MCAVEMCVLCHLQLKFVQRCVVRACTCDQCVRWRVHEWPVSYHLSVVLVPVSGQQAMAASSSAATGGDDRHLFIRPVR